MREFFIFFGSVRLGGVGGAAGDNTSVAAQITLRPVEATHRVTFTPSRALILVNVRRDCSSQPETLLCLILCCVFY